MAKKVFYTNADLNGNKLLNSRLEDLSTAPTPLGVGHVYFDTTLDSIGAYDGTVWVYNSSGGGIISVTYAQLTSLIGASGLIVGQNYLLTDFATRHEIPLSAIAEVFATSTLLEQIIPSTGTSVQIGARNYDFDGTDWSNQDDGFIHPTVEDAINADFSAEATAIFDGIDTYDLTAVIGGVAGNSIVTTVTPPQVGFSFPSGTLTGGADAIPNVVNTGSIEPLMLVANSTTTIDTNVISTLFGQDKLLYEVVDSTTAGGDTGRIYYRQDFNSNSTWYDWRVVLFRRWESAPLSGIYDQVFDNGGLFQDFFTFNNSAVALNCYNNVIGRASPSNIYVTDGLNNCVFNCPFYNVTTGLEFIWNTFIGDAFRDTTVGDNCNSNIIGAGFFNKIGDNFQSNTIITGGSVNAFRDNVIQNSFTNNTIDCLSFENNIIGSNVAGLNIINAGKFQKNIIASGFASANLSSATLVYTAYDKTITRRSDSAYTLWYIDNTNTIIYNLPTD